MSIGLTASHRFALNNIHFILAYLIWTFDMKLGDGARDWTINQKVFNGWLQPVLHVLLEGRHGILQGPRYQI